jgi:hypothetical protein
VQTFGLKTPKINKKSGIKQMTETKKPLKTVALYVI